jgi:CheY-like chemotaxis protein
MSTSIDIDFSQLTILIAEDEEINFMYLEEVLRRTNANVIRACDGLEAVNLFKENLSIDIVLMDIKMPVMDGIQATKLIKAERSNIPIIATTAYALGGDKEKFLQAGCDDYLSKPIRKDDLLAMIKKHI